MHVAPKAEPAPPGFDFDGKVRRPGKRLLMELRGDPKAPKRPGPRRKPVAKIQAKHLTDYWTRALRHLAVAYRRTCAYACLRIDPAIGNATVDHWKPKEKYPDRAYEWANFRFASLTMNRRKGTDETLCDPFKVQDDWFLLDLVTFALSPSPTLTATLRRRVEHTIDVLELDRQPMRKRREAAWKLYADKPSAETWRHMKRDCPLVARQYLAQRGLPPELAPPRHPGTG